MQTPEQNNRPEAPEHAPERLVAALREALAEKPFVPRTVDEAVLRAARERLQPAGRPFHWGWSFLRWATALGAAAACAWLALHWTAQPKYDRADLNHDGRVDILDAFALSKALESGAKLSLQLDFNADGKVDQSDVTVLADQAVRLATHPARPLGPLSARESFDSLNPSFLVITPKAYR